MEGVGPPVGDAGQTAHIRDLLVISAQRIVNVGQHLLAIGGRPDRVLQARLGAEAGGPLEARRDRAPEGTASPPEGVALAIPAHLLGTTAELLTDRPLPLRVAGRRTQVEERRVDVATSVARIVLERLVALLKVHAEPVVAGG